MVQMPYLTLAGIVICIGIAIALVRLPRISHDRASAGTLPGLRSVLREPALAGAVIAQFFYVGAQVGVWSFFIDFVKELSPATPERTAARSEEHTSELQSLMRISYAVFCLKKK